jgi:multicomponent Na+:H+ antiporter subunit B
MQQSDNRGEKMKNETLVIGLITKAALSFIVLFAFYIQFHGEISPGGAFQSGIILAMAFILHNFVADIFSMKKFVLKKKWLISGMIVGLIFYGGIGVIGTVLSQNFLSYDFLCSSKNCQPLGIFIVEIGVAICVFCSMSLIYLSLMNEFVLSKSEQ